MLKRKSLLCLLLSLAIINVSLLQVNGTCELLKPDLNNTKIFNAYSIYEQYSLEGIFSGYNLSFTTEFLTENQTLLNSIEVDLFPQTEVISNSSLQNILQQLDVEVWEFSNGNKNYARFTKTLNNGTGAKDYYQLFMGFSVGNKPSGVETEWNTPYIAKEYCFQITYVLPDRIVVDCTKEDSGTIVDYFYIVSTSQEDFFSFTKQSLNTYEFEHQVTDKEIITYFNNGKTYILSCILLDGVQDYSEYNITYINVYEFKNEKNTTYPQGYLEFIETINSVDLGWNQLNIADVKVLGDRIYVLDNTLGLASFIINSQNKIDQLKTWPLYQIFKIREAWGLAADFDGGFIQLTVVSLDQIFVMQQYKYDQEPSLVETYPLEVISATTVEIEVSSRYIVARVGQVLTIYKRYRFEESQIQSTLLNVNYFDLFDSEHLWVWTVSNSIVYLLQEPFVEFNQISQDDGGVEQMIPVKISAISTVLGKQYVCSLVLECVGVDPQSRDAYNSGFDNQKQVIQLSDDQFDYSIEREWYGPGLDFGIGLFEGKRFLEIIEDLEDPYVQFSTPKEITCDVPQDAPQSYIFSELIQVNDLVQIQLHQLQNYTLFIYMCFEDPQEIREVSCEIIRILDKLDSKISVFSDGYWSGLSSFVFVLEKHQNIIQFYDLTGKNLFNEVLNDTAVINSLFLSHNLLYVVDSGPAQSVLVFERTNEKFVQLYKIDSEYVKDWENIKVQGKVEWIPYAVRTHYHLSNVLVVQLKSNIVVTISLQNQATYLGSVFINQTCLKTIQCHIVVTSDQLLIVQSNDVIQRYQLFDLTKPDPLFKFQLYGYTFFKDSINQMKYTVSNSSGYLYVLAQNNYEIPTEQTNVLDPKINILVFRTDQEYIRTLYKVIQVGVTYDPKLPLTFNADGSDNVDFVYLSVNGESRFFRVPHEESIVIRPGNMYPYNSYSNRLLLNYYVKDLNGTKDPESLNILYINDQSEIFVNVDKIDESGFFNGIGGQKIPIILENYFHGPVLGLSADCNDCEGGFSGKNIISVQNRVERVKDIKQYNDLINVDDAVASFYDPDTQHTYLLSKEQVKVFDKQFKQIGQNISIDNKQCADEICYELQPCYDQTGNLLYIIPVCECSTGLWYASPIQVTNNKGQYSYTPKSQIILQKLEQEEFGESQCFDNKFYVLDKSDKDNSKNSIVVYDLISDIVKSNLISNISHTINNLFLNGIESQQEKLSMSSFELTRGHQDNITTLFITNETSIFVAVQIQFKGDKMYIVTGGVLSQDARYEFNTIDSLQEAEQYSSEKYKIISVKVLEVENLPSEGFINYRILIFTENIPIYEYIINFKLPKNIDKALLPDPDFAPVTTFGQYGKSVVQDYISILGNYFSVAFYDQGRQIYTFVVYQISNDLDQKSLFLSQRRSDSREPIFHQIYGGHDFFGIKLKDGQLPFAGFCLYENQQGEVSALVPSPNHQSTPVLISINSKGTFLQILNQNFPKQLLRISIDSSYKGEFSGVEVDGFITPIAPPPKPSSSDGWIIAISVIGGIILLGIIGFFGYKYYKKKQLSQEETDGMSLQEPLRA